MAPFFVLSVLFVILLGCGRFGFPEHFGWWTSLRIALSGMFLLTSISTSGSSQTRFNSHGPARLSASRLAGHDHGGA